MGKFYVYQLRVQGREKPFYIGKGTGRRCYVHFTSRDLMYCPNRHKSNTILKAYTEGFQIYIEVLEEGLEEHAALVLEREWVKHWGRRDLRTGCLTNQTDGGDGVSGHQWTEEARARQSIAQTGRKHTKESKLLMAERQLGKKHSEEAKLRMSEMKKGKKHSEETKLRMSIFRKGRAVPEEKRKKHCVPDDVIATRVALHTPLFEFLARTEDDYKRAKFRCKHCGKEVVERVQNMLDGKLPKEHYQCAERIFHIERATRVYSVPRGPLSIPRLMIEGPKDTLYTFKFARAGVIFFDLRGDELYRIRLPAEYTEARIYARL